MSSTSTTTMGQDAKRPRVASTTGGMTQEVEAPMRHQSTERTRALFMLKVEQDADGCWLWQGFIDGQGYGRSGAGQNIERSAHRLAYVLFKGPIPEGLTIDHLCRVRRCVNPDHLEAVTRRENIMRGDTIAARNAAKTHCKRGHEFTPENTYATATGGRGCRTCVRERQAAERDYFKTADVPGDATHGTRSTYNRYGCRCADCRAANARYRREQRVAITGDNYTSVTPEQLGKTLNVALKGVLS